MLLTAAPGGDCSTPWSCRDTDDLSGKGLWGDLKYVGICVLPPAWLVFTLQYTGRGHLVTRRLLAVLTAGPLIVLAPARDPRHP